MFGNIRIVNGLFCPWERIPKTGSGFLPFCFCHLLVGTSWRQTREKRSQTGFRWHWPSSESALFACQTRRRNAYTKKSRHGATACNGRSRIPRVFLSSWYVSARDKAVHKREIRQYVSLVRCKFNPKEIFRKPFDKIDVTRFADAG